MTSQHVPVARVEKMLIAGASAFAIVALASAVMLTASSREASAKPEFTAQTKLPCGQCHSNPAGGGALTATGKKFKANGNKMK